MSYNLPLLALSVLIAIVAGTAALWAGTRVSGLRATVGAALIMGVAVSGMHYTGMAALQIHRAAMPSMAAMASSGGIASVSGATAAVFLIPLLLVISIATFAVTLTITMAPGEEEIQADAEMQRRMEYLQQRRDWTQVPTGPRRGLVRIPPRRAVLTGCGRRPHWPNPSRHDRRDGFQPSSRRAWRLLAPRAQPCRSAEPEPEPAASAALATARQPTRRTRGTHA